MNDPPLVLVDSNVIIDIIQSDPDWLAWSVANLASHEHTMINPIIYSELCYQKTSVQELDQLMETLDLEFEELPREALFLAAQAFRSYRKRGGSKTSPLPDFFIGAHAATLGIPILTRDVARYKTYYPTVHLISP
jgi:predicted nucleic acid-binding protein